MNTKEIDNRRWLQRMGTAWSFVVLVMLAGCGDGTTLAPVKGKVTAKGEAVKGGSLTFSPFSDSNKPGKFATAVIQPDGTYILTTNSPDDGAVVGRHRLNFTPPEQVLTEAQRKDKTYTAPPPLYLGMVPKQAEVEVKSGENTIDIELVPGKSK